MNMDEFRSYAPEPYSKDADETVQCPNCRKFNSPDARYCDQCGYHMAANADYKPEAYSKDSDETVQCPECDKFNSPDASYCDQCGFRLVGSSASAGRSASSDGIEYRTATIHNLEVRTDSAGKPTGIGGYAAVFNQWADIVPGMLRERVAPGAFSKTIQEADVRALVNHDPNFVLGRNKANTLTLREDKQGLLVEVDTPDTQWARDLLVSMKRGDINQMSFGFQIVKKTDDNSNVNGPIMRTLNEVRLFDVSVVTYPAYESTKAWARSAIKSLQHILEPVGDVDHSAGPATLQANEPGDHSSAEPNAWQEKAQQRAAWLESLTF